MTTEKQSVLPVWHKWIKILLAVWSVVLGVAFIVAVCRVYTLGGARPFTVKNVTAEMAWVSLFIWVWLILLAASIVISILYTPPTVKDKGGVDESVTLKRLQARLLPNIQKEGGRYELYLQNENKYTHLQTAFGIAECVLWLIAVCVCAYHVSVAKQTYTADGLIFACLPWIIGGFILSLVSVYVRGACVKKQIALCKAQMALDAKEGIPLAKGELQPTLCEKIVAKFPFLQSPKFLAAMRIALATVGVVLVVVGICNGGMNEVFKKAVQLCRQCVGIG